MTSVITRRKAWTLNIIDGTCFGSLVLFFSQEVRIMSFSSFAVVYLEEVQNIVLTKHTTKFLHILKCLV